MTDFASLGIRADTSEVKEAKRDLAQLATEAERTESSVAAMQPAIQRASGGLRQMGDAGRQLAPALGSSAQGMRATTISAGQYSNAMRMLPAQITDIVTGLATGQPVFQVAIQQGGQIRDVFGGFGNAMRGIASVITPARLALGGIAGTAALLVKSFLDGRREAFELNRALILSGNAAGVTASELYGAARAMDSIAGTQTGANSVSALVFLSGPSPCDQCKFARRCRVESLACDAFVSFASGAATARWQSAPRAPTAATFQVVFRAEVPLRPVP